VPTGTAPPQPHQARNFALRGVAWSLGLFGVLRLPSVEAHAILPLTRLQGRIADITFGAPTLPVEVTLACSGADAIALCAGAILAYPARWSMRTAGAAAGVGLILLLNTVRIGTLGRAAGSASLFEMLHVYVWPFLLALAIAGYAFTWMRLADRTPAAPVSWRVAPETRRFLWLGAALFVLFTLLSSLEESAGVLVVAGLVATAAASALDVTGIEASAAGNVLVTTRGAFLVTQECMSTPLIPLYLAAVLAYVTGWRRRAVALLAAPLLFVGLAIARLLVVALPAYLVASPVFLVHAFYQLLLAAVVILFAARWRHGSGATAWRRAVLGGVVGIAVMLVLGDPYAALLRRLFAPGNGFDDPQGAVTMLAPFQVGLFIALCAAVLRPWRWRPILGGFALIGASHVVLFAGLRFLAEHDLTPHVRDIRAWAVVFPPIVIAAVMSHGQPRR
jgi:exosortase/archaeosortase family protein